MIEAGPSWTTIAMILFVIIGCILVVFLGYMVRSAYDMRIGLKAQMDRGLRAVEEDGAKKARALRQELGAEIERARMAIFEDGRRKVAEALAAMDKRQAEFETTVRQDRVHMTVSLDALRDELAELGRRIDELEREMLVGGPSGPIADPLQATPLARPSPPSAGPSESQSSGTGVGAGSAKTIVTAK
jgi:Tfp pilus assembly protein PilO